MKTVLRSALNACDVVLKKTYATVFSKAQFGGPAQTCSSFTPNVFTSILSPLESYVVSLQSLLIWERPYLSAASFVGLNCLFWDVVKMMITLLTWEIPLFSASALVFSNFIFWLVVSWNRRFFSIIAYVCLGVFLHRAWVKQIWPEIRVSQPEEEGEGWTPVHPQVLSVPELSQYINDFLKKLQRWWNDIMKLREANHGLFCILGCTIFSLVAFLGHIVPGVLIVYTLVLGISLGPGIALHLIPGTIYEQLAGLFVDCDVASSSRKQIGGSSKVDNDSDLDEFLPETSAEILRQLSLRRESMETNAGDVVESARITEEDEDDPQMATIRELGMDSFICESEESSMYTGLGGFPSVEEEGESDLEDELSGNLDLVIKPQESNVGMHFVASHFKEESSDSDSDAVFTEGLSFAKESKVQETKDQDSHLKSDNKTPNISSAVARVSTSSDFDEELMDFEILEETDIS